MATITPQVSSTTVSSGLDHSGGLNPIYTQAAADGDTYVNTGLEVLLLHNGDNTTHTATITAQFACNLGRFHTVSVAIGPGLYVQAGPFTPSYFNDAANMIHVSYDSVTNIQLCVVHP